MSGAPTRSVDVLDHVLVPMPDGTRLSARIWLPADALDHPVPALLEYLPYRKGDWTAARDAQRHPWYAARGYASVRVDLRGSGDSEGVMTDEYSETELADGEAVIAWLASQPWCTGAEGMFGISWGGFNSLQIAARRPPALKAIVTVCSSDDRYADDVHYFGGAVLGIDMLGWATTMLAFTARPPDPLRVGPAWERMWLQRLDAIEPFLDTWLSHQARDEYWRRGSVGEDHSAVTAAVLAVGGWADPYRDTVFRLLAGLRCPVKGIVGPWSHHYPDIDRPPGPPIGFLQETLRWWDRWLRDQPTGVEDDPPLRVWLQDSVRPATSYPVRPGRWIGTSWPTDDVRTRAFGLDELHSREASGAAPVLVASPQHCGIDAGRYFPFGNAADLPPDQREEDGRSVCFDTPSLDEPLTLLGKPAAALRVSADRAATLTVRICDVAPDGSSTLVTRGALDLRRRAGMDRTDPVDAPLGLTAPLDVVVTCTSMSWVFPPGHRIRVAVSTSYWPWTWPHPVVATVHLHPEGSSLQLPLRAADAPSRPVRFEPPEQAPALPVVRPVPGPVVERTVRTVPQTGEWELVVDPGYGGTRVHPDGLRYDEQARESYRITTHDPASAVADSTWSVRLRREGWDVGIEVSADMSVTPDGDFRTRHRLTATSNGEVVRDRSWDRVVPRTRESTP